MEMDAAQLAKSKKDLDVKDMVLVLVQSYAIMIGSFFYPVTLIVEDVDFVKFSQDLNVLKGKDVVNNVDLTIIMEIRSVKI